MQRIVNTRQNKRTTWNTIGTKPTNGQAKEQTLWIVRTLQPEPKTHAESRFDEKERERESETTPREWKKSAREKETQAINLPNIQFHSNYESTVRKLKRFIRVEKVSGANFYPSWTSIVRMRTVWSVDVCTVCLYRFSVRRWLFMSRDLSSMLTFPLVFSFFLLFFSLSRRCLVACASVFCSLFLFAFRLFTCDRVLECFAISTFRFRSGFFCHVYFTPRKKWTHFIRLAYVFPVSISLRHQRIKTHGKIFNFISHSFLLYQALTHEKVVCACARLEWLNDRTRVILNANIKKLKRISNEIWGWGGGWC